MGLSTHTSESLAINGLPTAIMMAEAVSMDPEYMLAKTDEVA